MLSVLPPELTEVAEFVEAVLAGIGEVDILCELSTDELVSTS